MTVAIIYQLVATTYAHIAQWESGTKGMSIVVINPTDYIESNIQFGVGR